jgi:hypothetical protein
MDISGKAHQEAQEVTLQYLIRQESLLDHELTEDKLTQLLAFIGELEQTPEGTDEIQRRVKLLGECKRSRAETSKEFYSKLRHWLDREIPQTKPPLHPPRQTHRGPTQ